MKNSPGAVLSWIIFGILAVSLIMPGIITLSTRPGGYNPRLVDLLFPLIPVSFAFFGALIISRQPGNRIGLLMLLPALSLFPLVDAYLAPFIAGLKPLPQPPSAAFLVILWFSNWNWTLFVFPAIFIMLLFPTGRPLSRRWGWLAHVGIGLAALLPIFATFSQSLSPGAGNAAWSYPNPIGFLEAEWLEPVLAPFFFIFPAWIILCVISLYVRFRHARTVEREQIKWLFFAAAVFAACYVPTFFGSTFSDTESFWNFLFALGMFAFPAAIAIAILRYRLYDIELIIRRTLQYTLLTGLLSLVYFGGVALLQAVIGGQSSPVVVVLTTLTIAALFNPLRRRIQEFIDRRFYRQKYDAEKALAEFAAAARSETDLAQLSTRLTDTVQETLQPEYAGLWLFSLKKGSER
jgi:hypothetical protein